MLKTEGCAGEPGKIDLGLCQPHTNRWRNRVIYRYLQSSLIFQASHPIDPISDKPARSAEAFEHTPYVRIFQQDIHAYVRGVADHTVADGKQGVALVLGPVALDRREDKPLDFLQAAQHIGQGLLDVGVNDKRQVFHFLSPVWSLPSARNSNHA